MGQSAEALQAVQETVVLWRQLETDQPTEFIPDLVLSLNGLSLRLSALGC